jgi:hypothetical protein
MKDKIQGDIFLPKEEENTMQIADFVRVLLPVATDH